jgi:hypothetical protein
VIRRLVTSGALGLVAALSLAAPSPVLAATYPPLGGVEVTVNTTSPVVGNLVTVTASGMAPASDVEISASPSTTAMGAVGHGVGRFGTAKTAPVVCSSSVMCTVTADSAGTATAAMRVMSVGPLVITIRGVDSSSKAVVRTVTIDVVAAPGSSSPSGLVRTGAGRTLQLVEVGVAFVLLGSVVALTVRRRREGMLAP